jgi:4-hydroxy-2-oxoheptanedioate aldolase
MMPLEMPVNRLKRALRDGPAQIGLWSSLSSHIAAEIVAGAGFDWVLLDTEHSPNDLADVHRQLQAMQGSATSAVVRPAWNDPVAFKRLLDLGVQSLLVPYVQNAEEARRAVAATRYPPAGIRGVATTTRASRYGRVKDYLGRAHEEICVIVQVETRAALAGLEAIAAVEGVDALFIGPSDLAADMGHLGNHAHPEVRAAMDDAIGRIRATGRAAGTLTAVEADARRWLDLGCNLLAVGSDAGILARQADALALKFKCTTAGART